MSMVLFASSAYSQTEEKKYELSFELDLGADLTTFFQPAAYEGQQQWYPSLFVKPKFNLDWNKGKSSILFEGFARWDMNGDSRSHVDIREFYYQYYKDSWEFSLGVKKVFWGKTEGVHLVNVINQIDFLEGIDGEEKLGQPMLQLSHTSNLGTFTGFVLPYTREIDFGNAAGRPRTPAVITDDKVSFESNNEAWHPTFALRWEHFIGNSDIGLHYFNGNARDPLVVISQEGNFGLEYPLVNQVGLDYQVIVKNTILKLEALYRGGDFDDIMAITGGVEYTFGNVNGKGLDIGVLGEYVFDNRRSLTFSSLDNDIFIATRLAFNNVVGTEILVGAFQDLSKSTKVVRLEGSQRIGENLKVTVTGQAFLNVDSRELAYLFRQDSFFELEFIRYF